MTPRLPDLQHKLKPVAFTHCRSTQVEGIGKAIHLMSDEKFTD